MRQRSTAAVATLIGLGLAPAAAQAKGFAPGDKLSLRGLGDVKLGMTRAQMRAVSDVYVRRSVVGACTYYDAGDPRKSFSGPRFRFQDGKLVVIEVGRNRRYRTVKNLGHGSKKSSVRKRYKGTKSVRSIGGGSSLRWTNKAGDRGYAFRFPFRRAESVAVGLIPYIDQQECS